MGYPHVLAAIFLVIGACACFSALDTTTKYVSSAAPLLMVLWFAGIVPIAICGAGGGWLTVRETRIGQTRIKMEPVEI